MKTGLPLAQDAVRLFGDDGSPLFSGKKGDVIPGTGQPGIPSTGSAKCDAYLWAKHRYLDAGLTSPRDMAYYIDSYWLRTRRPRRCRTARFRTMTSSSPRKAFFFDLGVWEEESPVDDPSQTPGTDLATLKVLLRAMHDRAGGKDPAHRRLHALGLEVHRSRPGRARSTAASTPSGSTPRRSPPTTA